MTIINYHNIIYYYNVKLGLINPAVIINPLCPPQKM